jgi:hypothetical protein
MKLSLFTYGNMGHTLPYAENSLISNHSKIVKTKFTLKI